MYYEVVWGGLIGVFWCGLGCFQGPVKLLTINHYSVKQLIMNI